MPLLLADQTLIDGVICEYFKEISRDAITVSPLLGGNSNKSYLISTPSKKYVLRIKETTTPLALLNREIFAMQQAAELGISPQVYYVSPCRRAIVMDYIEGKTCSTKESRQLHNCIQLGQILQKVHSLPQNPHFNENFNEVENVYLDLCTYNYPEIKPQVDKAYELWKFHIKEHAALYPEKRTIHCELNPRNIFITPRGISLIDWEYSTWDDPFFDLSYLAIFHGYPEEVELLLLQSYLQHRPLPCEIEHYQLTKKIHFYDLCMAFHYFSIKLNPERLSLDSTKPLKKWSDYMESFSEGEESTAQFFYDIARLAFDLAQGLHSSVIETSDVFIKKGSICSAS